MRVCSCRFRERRTVEQATRAGQKPAFFLYRQVCSARCSAPADLAAAAGAAAPKNRADPVCGSAGAGRLFHARGAAGSEAQRPGR